METNFLRSVSCLLILVPTVLTAQSRRPHDPVALKHWAAPLYWLPTQTSAEWNALATREDAGGLPANASPLVFVALTPCRIIDTRAGSLNATGAFGPPSLVAGASRTFPILSSTTCKIPSVAQAYSFEITVVPPGPLSYITAFPTGEASPVAAIAVESPQGYLLSNTGIIPAGTNGSVDIYASNPTDVVIDINGYYAALTSSTASNTAIGNSALLSNTTGVADTSIGALTLQNNTTGYENTAVGAGAMKYNTTGYDNTAVGDGALMNNTTGTTNTATGSGSLSNNTTGIGNTATGVFALVSNTTGNGNTADGGGALSGNTAGVNNTAMGVSALAASTGSNNVAIGYKAGFNLGFSSTAVNNNNIHISSQGTPTDNATIRIGTPGTQTSFFAAGVRGITTGNNDAVPVVIDSNGQLGSVSSSRRFKEDIEDMGTASSDVMRLHPVTFRYRKPFADGSKPVQYGLIAEEVADVYPELVVRSWDGQIESVKYQVLDSMLLNELQKEHLRVQQQAETIDRLDRRLVALEEALRASKQAQ